ncbi:hypothetical protein AGMMS49942_06420 [Spirochaetia bacterium]|nr:hypothetical protein AGMMS4952_23440 [Spirochaetia bacterium]GHV75821.1 hypothetical protein AGMMS49942_06420 [Spirochaetia bacterium]
MKVYRSKIYEALHEDFKLHLEMGGITQERFDEFERDAFKEVPDAPTPQGRVAHTPAMATASPGTQAHSVK